MRYIILALAVIGMSNNCIGQKKFDFDTFSGLFEELEFPISGYLNEYMQINEDREALNRSFVSNYLKRDSIKTQMFKYYPIGKLTLTDRLIAFYEEEMPSGGVSLKRYYAVFKGDKLIEDKVIGSLIIDGSNAKVVEYEIGNDYVLRQTYKDLNYDMIDNSFTEKEKSFKEYQIEIP